MAIYIFYPFGDTLNDEIKMVIIYTSTAFQVI